jgi:4-hydroxybenzoate polyprenyltransferase/phosphoserine phosphatase
LGPALFLTHPDTAATGHAAPLAARREADTVPLVVDLDGTLVLTDTLLESVLVQARQEPRALVQLPGWLRQGRAVLKRRLAERWRPDVQALPYNEDLVSFLRAQRSAGRRLVLATGADRAVADEVAAHLGLFDEVLASDGDCNLRGAHKRDRLVAAYGEHGFDYAGNGWADLPVWTAARRAIVVGGTGALREVVGRHATLERTFNPRPAWPGPLLDAMRWPHWVKNLLVLLPLLLLQAPRTPASLGAALLAFVAFCLGSASVYLLNDLVDLPKDRLHPHKRLRALASGRLAPTTAVAAVLVLWAAVALACLALPLPSAVLIAGYVKLMLSYSLWLKNIPGVDVLVLGAGYTLRLFAGAAALGLALPWPLPAWSMLAFCGFAALKRRAELARAADMDGSPPRVRCYRASDASMLEGLGRVGGLGATALLAAWPALVPLPAHWPLWLLALLQMAWTEYLWREARNGRIRGDPVHFALADGRSRLVGGIALVLLAWLA